MIWVQAAQLAAKVHVTNAARVIARAAQIAAQGSAADSSADKHWGQSDRSVPFVLLE